VAQFLGSHQSFDGDRVGRLLVMQKFVELLPKLLGSLFRPIGARFRCVGPLLRLIRPLFRLIASGSQGGNGRPKGVIRRGRWRG
jgi:hypothetical protein